MSKTLSADNLENIAPHLGLSKSTVVFMAKTIVALTWNGPKSVDVHSMGETEKRFKYHYIDIPCVEIPVQ